MQKGGASPSAFPTLNTPPVLLLLLMLLLSPFSVFFLFFLQFYIPSVYQLLVYVTHSFVLCCTLSEQMSFFQRCIMVLWLSHFLLSQDARQCGTVGQGDGARDDKEGSTERLSAEESARLSVDNQTAFGDRCNLTSLCSNSSHYVPGIVPSSYVRTS